MDILLNRSVTPLYVYVGVGRSVGLRVFVGWFVIWWVDGRVFVATLVANLLGPCWILGSKGQTERPVLSHSSLSRIHYEDLLRLTMTARGGARDVRVEVAPGTLGVKFEADYNGNCAIVKRFMVLPSGQESPLKRHVPVGWAMVMCNDKDLSAMKYADVLSHMKKVGNHRRTLIFRESSSHYSKAHGGSLARRKNDSADLDVEVTQFRLNRESTKQFAEYEVICTLRRKPDVR